MNQPAEWPGPVVCPICRSGSGRVEYDFRGRATPLGIAGLVVRCLECGMWYKQEEWPERHWQAYGTEYAGHEEGSPYMSSAVARKFFARTLARVSCRPRAGGAARPRLLDIGTGMGTLLEVAEGMGFEAEGLEACAPLAEQAVRRGLRVKCLAGDELAASETYDVVTLMDVIEHVADPVALLGKVRRALKPGGEAVVYTPNHRGAVVEMAKILHRMGIGDPVRQIFAGNHLCFFDDRSLPRALAAAGLAVRGAKFFPYNPARPGQPVAWASLVAVTAVEWMGAPFGRVFRMIYYAQKPTGPVSGASAGR